jgi:hypothetical protein
VAEETNHGVLLVHRDENAVDGFHIYRGEHPAEPDQIITVEMALTPVPRVSPGPSQTCSALVTRVIPGTILDE